MDHFSTSMWALKGKRIEKDGGQENDDPPKNQETVTLGFQPPFDLIAWSEPPCFLDFT